MSLQFITGGAGGPKSEYLFTKITNEAAKDPGRNYLVIVPEQFTLAAQKKLVQLSLKHGIMNIDVLSFDRLAYRVFAELGTPLLDILEDTGKNLLLRRVASEKAEELGILKGNMTKPGYIDEMKSLITELTQYNISVDKFKEMEKLPDMTPGFYAKAKDIAVMYEGFRDAMEGRYITAEEVLTRLVDVIDESKMVRDAVIALDGFTGFTPVQKVLLSHMLRLAKNTYVTITIDPAVSLTGPYAPQDLFAMSQKEAQSLIRIAQEAKEPLEDPVVLTEENHYEDPSGMLVHLEQNLFRAAYKKYKRQEAYVKTDNCGFENQEAGMCDSSIKICRLLDPRDELSFAAAKIRELVRTKGLRYKDCAVICADPLSYTNYAEAIFRDYEIPVYIDAKTDIVFHPFTEMIPAAFDTIETNFSSEAVMHLIRTGLTELSPMEGDLLENYIETFRIRGLHAYKKPFTKTGRGIDETMLAQVNEIRAHLMEALLPFAEAVEGEHTVKEFSTALYMLITAWNAEEKLWKRADIFEERGEEIAAAANEKIYEIVMNLLDQMVYLLSDETMDASEYAALLEAGFKGAEIGTVPMDADSVIIGDMERTRLENIKILFLLGASDAAIPKASSGGGILSQAERQLLAQADVELAPSERERSFMQRFYIYLALTKPSRELVITYPRLDTEGKALRASYLIRNMLDMFPEISIENMENKDPLGHIVTNRSAGEFLRTTLRDAAQGEIDLAGDDAVKEVASALLAWYSRSVDRMDELQQILANVYFEKKPEQVDPEIIKKAAGDTIKGSVTRLEQYAKCAYSYFLAYGLKLTQRAEGEIGSLDMGTLYHAALENYSLMLMDQKLSWHAITEEKSAEILKIAVRQAYDDNYPLETGENPREEFILRQMEETLQRTVWALTRQIRAGEFEPAGFEVSFSGEQGLSSMNIPLNNGERLNLKGKIDRVDTFKKGDKNYVKIVDYKSGTRKLDLAKMYYGLQIQLILYMTAAAEAIQRDDGSVKAVPAGMFYYHIDNPYSEKSAEEEVEKDLLKQLRMEGVVRNEDEAMEAMDESLMPNENGEYKTESSLYIPVRRTKKGGLNAVGTNAVGPEDFETMSKYVRKNLQNTGNSILEGKIDAKPYRMEKETGCDYCPYHAVCGFDPHMKGFAYRKLKNMKSDEVLMHMKEETEVQTTDDVSRHSGNASEGNTNQKQGKEA